MFFFFFFFLLNIYVSWYIYCYTNTTNFTIFSQLLMCTNALKHCNYNALVSWATVATVIFFFSSNRFVIFFFLLNIYVSWYIYCYTNTKNFTIFSQLLTCQFLTSRNKIIKYEIDQSQLKINVLRKCYNTYCAVLLVYSTGKVAIVPNVFFFFFFQ